MQGLNITEDDIRTAALQNNDPAYDVQKHRQNEDKCQTSRGYQSLVLLSIAKNTEKTRTLLRDWATGMDVDMSVAAKIGLALNGR